MSRPDQSAPASAAPTNSNSASSSYWCKRDWWTASYLLDWASAVFVLVLGGLVYLLVAPTEREVPGGAANYDVQYDKPDKDIFPNWTLAFFEGLIPLFVLGVSAWKTRSAHDVHHFALGFLTTFGHTLLWTAVPVKFVGMPRPSFLDRGGFKDDGSSGWDRYQSYPSGHATTAMAALTYLALYMAGKLRVFAQRVAGERPPLGGIGWRLVLVTVPPFLAMLVSTSRVHDNAHSTADVNFGMAIGLVMGTVGYFTVFPSLFDANSHLPRNRVANTHTAARTHALTIYTSVLSTSSKSRDQDMDIEEPV